MIVFIAGALAVWVVLFFETSITNIAAGIAGSCCSRKTKRIKKHRVDEQHVTPGEEETPGGPPRSGSPTPMAGLQTSEFVCSDDIYKEYNFSQLYKELKKLRQEKQRIMLQRGKNRFSVLEMKKYVAGYISVIERNEAAVYKRLRELTDFHIEMIEEVEPDMMTETEKIKTVLEYYN